MTWGERTLVAIAITCTACLILILIGTIALMIWAIA